MPESELRYFDYVEEVPPRELDDMIEKQGLKLPVLFIDGRPAFSGGLPAFDALLEAVRSR